MSENKYNGNALVNYNAEFDLDPYFPSNDLVRAVEIARLLSRPLLLRGAPGSGKTRLAEAIAFELYGEEYKTYYFRWNIKSTTKAQDGMYQFDHLQRLRDAQTGENIDPIKYRKLGPLGEAFQRSKENAPAILLIDEIDKADIDFPNDLLDVLEDKKKSFIIKETGETIPANFSPIIIITSNDERELPDAFLRRCVFHYLAFPTEEHLLKLAKANIEKYKADDRLKEMLKPLIKFFLKKQQEMEADPNTDKIISTSELLDWLRVISFYQPYLEKKKEREVDGVVKEVVLAELWYNKEDKQLEFLDEKILYPEVLFKSHDDWKSQLKR